MKRKSNKDSCARNKAASPVKNAPQKDVASAVKRKATDTKTKPASKRRESGGGQIRSGVCLNQAGETVSPNLLQLSKVKAKTAQWLWENRIPRGTLSMIAGLGGDGKSLWSVNMASHITNGTDWDDGAPCEEGSVLFFHGEDGLADIYKKRCEANKVKQSRVVFMDGAKVSKGEESTEVGVTVADIEVIRQAIRDTGEKTGLPVKAVFIDPITNYLGNVSVNSAGAVRSVLYPLQRLAEELDVAIVLIHHFAKSKKAHLQQQISGSGALVECCRAVWGIFHDPADDMRYFAPVKFNYGVDATAVSFRITGPSGKVKVLETDIHRSAEEISDEITAAKKAAVGRPPKALVEVSSWLSDLLGDGEKPVNEIHAAAEARGFSVRTVSRAKEALGVKSVKRGFGKGSCSVWTLPTAKECQNSKGGKKPKSPKAL